MGGAMFWVISIAIEIATVTAIASAISFRDYLVNRKVCQKGSAPPRLASHAYLWMEEVNRPRRAPGSYLFIVRAGRTGQALSQRLSMTMGRITFG